jgi:hypothetical protein
MAQAAPDPGTGPITPSKKLVRRVGDTILPIPAGRDLMPGAVWVDPIHPSSSAASSSPASSSPPSSSASGAATSGALSSAISSAISSGFVPNLSSGIPSAPISPMSIPTSSPSASLGPHPHPMPSASSGVDISINVNINQTISVDSPEYGAAGYGWWSCSEEKGAGKFR